MLFPLERLLEDRGAPLCVTQETQVKDALALMVEHNYSQLPVVTAAGDLVGIVSERTIIRNYYHLDGSVSLLSLPVDHCKERAMTLPPDHDVFGALDRLKDVAAIVVTRDQKPIGILTDYDTTYFFREISEGLILVEDVEVTLRQRIELAFPNESTQLAALMIAFGQDRRDPSKLARELDRLNLNEYIQFITHERNWAKFEGAFEPKEMFRKLMEQVRDIRNQLAHFRGRLDRVQYDALLRAEQWLSTRPRPIKLVQLQGSSQGQSGAHGSLTVISGTADSEIGGMLGSWLRERPKRESDVRLRFDEVEQLWGELPAGAREHRSWWDNDPTDNPHSLSWMQAGWRVEDVDLTTGAVVFHRTTAVLQQLFFLDLLHRLKAQRPGLTRATRTQAANWWQFGAGRSGFTVSWVFGQQNDLRMELVIATGDQNETKELFTRLHAQQAAIEKEMDAVLKWDVQEARKSAIISLSRPGRITDPPDKLEEAKTWMLETTLRFIDAFQDRIKRL